jgi:hypothetical protein
MDEKEELEEVAKDQYKCCRICLTFLLIYLTLTDIWSWIIYDKCHSLYGDKGCGAEENTKSWKELDIVPKMDRFLET